MNNIRHYVLSNSLNLSGVHLVFDQWYKQTLYVSYFTQLVLGSFGNGQVNKIRQYVLAILLSLLRDNYVKNSE